MDLKGNVLKQYPSGNAVCEEVACHPTALLAVLEGKAYKVGGLKFAFAPDDGGGGMDDLGLDSGEEEEAGAGKNKKKKKKRKKGDANKPKTRLQSVLMRIGDKADAGAPPLRRVALSFEGLGDDECEELGEGLAKSAVTQIFLVKNAITDIGLLVSN